MVGGDGIKRVCLHSFKIFFFPPQIPTCNCIKLLKVTVKELSVAMVISKFLCTAWLLGLWWWNMWLNCWGGVAFDQSHLASWNMIYTGKGRGVGVRDLKLLNGAVLCKYSWRLVMERGALWRNVICEKYGEEVGGWQSKERWEVVMRLVKGLNRRSFVIFRTGETVYSSESSYCCRFCQLNWDSLLEFVFV